MNDRIKLAEAMGWISTSSHTSPDGVKESYRWRDPETGTAGNTELDLPDPFTDANDDYAVLEWMRARPELILTLPAKFTEVVNSRLDDTNMWNYCLGDYARAALKVLETDDER